MLGKLLKYDIKSAIRPFALLWAATLIVGAANSFTLNADVGTKLGVTTAGVMMLVYFAILIALMVVCMIFTLQRFYRGLLGDEGYLMHTLPVRPWQLITSKLLAAMAAIAVSAVVATVSALLLVSDHLQDFPLRTIIRRLVEGLTAGEAVRLVVAALVGLALLVLRFYAAMSLGHLANKHRAAWSLVAYLVVGAVENFVTGLVGDPDSGIGFIFSAVGGANTYVTGWSGIALSAVIAAVYFGATNYILGHRLNLE